MLEKEQEIDRAAEELREYLKAFVFFHLGSDADLEWRREGEKVWVKVAHPRVEPFSFRLDRRQLLDFSSAESKFEEFLLGLLTHYRRS